jgi:hypothetical protein
MRCRCRSRILIEELQATQGVVMVSIESRRSLGVALAWAVVASAGLMATYYYGGVAGHADDTPVRAALVGTGGAAIAALLVWSFTRGAFDGTVDFLSRRTALLGVIAAVSLAGFWIGITVPVCVAAVAVGLKAVAVGRTVRGYVVVGVAMTVLLASVVLCVLGSS